MTGAREYVSLVSDVVQILTIVVAVGAAAVAWVFWRSRFRRHKFAKVYFPKDRADFYAYYVKVVARAKRSVFVTSDGFNMCNAQSAAAAEQMNLSQANAISNGATVVRYQMLQTMHINWLYEIVRMKEAHGDRYKTVINRGFEHIGSFAVIDPGTRKAVVEFMLPETGGLAQATTARDFGFIHGHQAKADKTKEIFERIMNHPDTIEVSADNYREIAKRLFTERCDRHRSDPAYHLFDEEVLVAMKRCPGREIRFSDVKFFGWPTNTRRRVGRASVKPVEPSLPPLLAP